MKKYVIPIILLICIIAFLLKYGGFPVSNFLEKYPQVYHDKYSEFYQNDFLVQSSQNLEIRKVFIYTFNFTDRFIGNYEFTHAFLLFLCMFIFSLGFYKVVFLLTDNEDLALMSIIFPLILSVSKIGIGNIFMISNFLDSIKFSWALTIWAIYYHLRDKNAIAFLLIGISSMFHVVFGLLMFGVFFLSLLYFKKYNSIYSSSLFIIPFSIINVPLYFSELKTSINNPTLIHHILFEFRAPHHYLPHKWSVENWSIFLIFLFIFIFILFKYSKIKAEYYKRIIVFVYIILFFYTVSLIFSSLIPINFMIKLQIFRISEFLNLLQFIIFSEFFYHILYKKLSNRIKIILLIILLLISMVFTFYNPLFQRGDYDKETDDLYNYIKLNTNINDVILSPPYISTFRSGSLRAIVVDKKSEPVSEKALLEWYNRMNDITKNQTSLLDNDLKDSYNSLNEEDIIILQNKYNFKYAVFEKPSELNFPIVYSNKKYVMYEIIIKTDINNS